MSLIYYAIGDIHGELEKLRSLHDRISDFHNAIYPTRPHIRIHLGDYVDRGPNSKGVLNFIQSLEEDEVFDVINLKGNHETLMLRALRTSEKTPLKHWLVNGGDKTMASYDTIDKTAIILKHITWIETLPTLFEDRARRLVFVHAGINPESYPEHDEAVHLWTRNAAFFESETWENPALDNVTVIHGHTPTLTDYPDISKDGRRINVDTGACYDGPLSAVVLADGEKPRFLFSD